MWYKAANYWCYFIGLIFTLLKIILCCCQSILCLFNKTVDISDTVLHLEQKHMFTWIQNYWRALKGLMTSDHTLWINMEPKNGQRVLLSWIRYSGFFKVLIQLSLSFWKNFGSCDYGRLSLNPKRGKTPQISPFEQKLKHVFTLTHISFLLRCKRAMV